MTNRHCDSHPASPSLNARPFYLPPVSDTAEFLYKTTDYWAPEFERSLALNDPPIGIQWPIQGEPSLSAKDQQAKALAEAEHFA